jgi:multidrug resistance efflux pump
VKKGDVIVRLDDRQAKLELQYLKTLQSIKEKDKRNFLQVGPLRIEKSAYSAMWEVLAIFMLLVIMLAVLRIEQNTRK